MDGVNNNLNLLHDDSCEICGTLTCERLTYQDTLREYYETLDLQDDMINNQKKFQLYRHWIRIYHGVLGTGAREQLLLVCTKDYVEQRFPYKVGDIRVRFRSAD